MAAAVISRGLALALAALAGCTSMAVDARTFDGTSWHVTAINGHRTPAGFVLRFTNGQVGGQFGCNNFGGPYRVSDDVMITGALAMTQMACDTAVDGPAVSPMQWESWGLAVIGLPMRMSWKSGRQLTLSNAAGSIELERER